MSSAWFYLLHIPLYVKFLFKQTSLFTDTTKKPHHCKLSVQTLLTSSQHLLGSPSPVESTVESSILSEIFFKAVQILTNLLRPTWVKPLSTLFKIKLQHLSYRMFFYIHLIIILWNFESRDQIASITLPIPTAFFSHSIHIWLGPLVSWTFTFILRTKVNRVRSWPEEAYGHQDRARVAEGIRKWRDRTASPNSRLEYPWRLLKEIGTDISIERICKGFQTECGGLLPAKGEAHAKKRRIFLKCHWA